MSNHQDIRVSLLGMIALCSAGCVALAVSMATTAFPVQVAASNEDTARREALRIMAEAYGYRLEESGR